MMITVARPLGRVIGLGSTGGQRPRVGLEQPRSGIDGVPKARCRNSGASNAWFGGQFGNVAGIDIETMLREDASSHERGTRLISNDRPRLWGDRLHPNARHPSLTELVLARSTGLGH